jgi:hypothetical protein
MMDSESRLRVVVVVCGLIVALGPLTHAQYGGGTGLTTAEIVRAELRQGAISFPENGGMRFVRDLSARGRQWARAGEAGLRRDFAGLAGAGRGVWLGNFI